MKRSAPEELGDPSKRAKPAGGGIAQDQTLQRLHPFDRVAQLKLAAMKAKVEEKRRLLLEKQRAAAPAAAAATPAAGSAAPDISQLKANVAAKLAAMRAQGGMPTQRPGAAWGVPGAAAFHAMQQQAARPGPLLLDKQGRLVDASGKEIKLESRRPDFIANIGAAKDAAEKKATEQGAAGGSGSANPYFDERLPQKEVTRDRRKFNFNEQGKFVELASKQRAKAQLEKLQQEIEKAAKKTGISNATKLALIAPLKSNTEDLTVPDIEWWDAMLLPPNGYASLDEEGGLQVALAGGKGREVITHLIQHPVELKPPGESNQVTALPVMLTKTERKKMRTQRRKAEEKERQEKIRLGLMEAPAPKVKKANFMRVLGNDAVSNPTMVEQVVAGQAALRQRDHKAANASRKLTKEERKEKTVSKFTKDAKIETKVLVFRIQSLQNPSHKFKVSTNARQYYLSGCALMTKNEGLNLVVVEGGAKSIGKFKKLMMRRIKWAGDEDADDDDDEDDAGPKNACALVWEGSVGKRAFTNFEAKMCRTEEFARDHLEKHGVPHYWDMALADAVKESA